MSYISISNIKQELVNFIRNSDIISVGDRGVTTYADTGTFYADSSHTLGNTPTKVKNVRSVIVSGSTLVYGTDYSIAFVTGVITFTSAQTGAYTISYDAGSTDKIYPDFPRDDLSISSYPRIAVDVISMSSGALGLGNENVSSILFSVVVYADKQGTITDYLDTIRQKFIDNHKSFTYLTKIVPTAMGPMISAGPKQQILHQNLDLESPYVFEINN